MKEQNSEERIRGYCSQCTCYCPTVAYVKNGTFTEAKPDEEHPNACELCPRGLAGPELVYNRQRLRYPMRRTSPKGDPNPGWERISWDEALATITKRLNEIKAQFGSEAVAFARCGPGGSPMSETFHWIKRLAYAFGTPNIVETTHICNWHKDQCSRYTFGMEYLPQQTLPDFEHAGCILIWGNNPHATRYAQLRDIKRGLEQGAKLVVIDPRKIPIAGMANLWLPVQPGTDGLLALSMIHVIIEEDLYDYEFVRDWTTAPFLVRGDTGNFLKGSDLKDEGAPLNYVMVNSSSKKPEQYIPGSTPFVEPALDIELTLKLVTGEKVKCKTVSRLLRELVSEYPPHRTETSTWIPADKVKDAVRMFATAKPACWYSYNGLEQSTNASQTNRAISIFYALTGNYDTHGGNLLFPAPSVNRIDGLEFLNPKIARRRLGFQERPLGPVGTVGAVQAYEVYKSILTGKPYPVKALIGFGGNVITSSAPSMVAKDAISKLDFHVQCELFLTPTAELADIVLPAASFWESLSVRANFRSPGATTHVQLREPVIPPQHDSWPDMKVIFEMAKRLGLGDKFWDGNIESAFNYMIAPSNITVEQLRRNPGGISLNLPLEYKKYEKKDRSGKFLGFDTPSKRVELYSQIFKEHGYDPLPAWKEPPTFRFAQTNLGEKYPLILINTKLLHYSHGQHRAIPSLRKAVPYPFVEINHTKASELGIEAGEWVILESPYGSVTLQAKPTDTVPYGVVSTQHGWWQECQDPSAAHCR
ncbi:MAG: molybdopterin-dependent oxidoreductase [Deltaproteobacteria bacterium]|nr:molybdopterin-dependent oxidoreductase [Deltaproteobacteria bacterium]